MKHFTHNHKQTQKDFIHELSVQVQCRIQEAWGWCTGMTQRDGMGKEVGGGFRMGNTCTPVADACWCMAKPIQYCRVKNNNNNKILKNKKRIILVGIKSLMNILIYIFFLTKNTNSFYIWIIAWEHMLILDNDIFLKFDMCHVLRQILYIIYHIWSSQTHHNILDTLDSYPSIIRKVKLRKHKSFE